jgi:fumarate reductase subunit D
MPYEHHQQPLLTHAQFARRVLGHFALGLGAVAAALLIGIFGYHWIAGFNWVDSFLNAAMILGGMGPIGELPNDAAKIFAGAYALFAGLFFIAMMGLLLAPFLHRIAHRLHIKDQ